MRVSRDEVIAQAVFEALLETDAEPRPLGFVWIAVQTSLPSANYSDFTSAVYLLRRQGLTTDTRETIQLTDKGRETGNGGGKCCALCGERLWIFATSYPTCFGERICWHCEHSFKRTAPAPHKVWAAHSRSVGGSPSAAPRTKTAPLPAEWNWSAKPMILRPITTRRAK